MAVAAPGQLNLEESPSWGSRSVDCFDKIEQIGEGTYGQVYMAREKANGEIVALKKVRMDNEKEGFPITAIREIKILKKLQHENVIKLKEIVTSMGSEQDDEVKASAPGAEDGKGVVDTHKYKGSIYMVFEYMDHDLAGLADRPGMRFTIPQIKCYMKQLLTGLHYCHVNQVLHRDIKGSNLLIDNNGNLKLADFGLARSFSNDQNGVLTNRVITLWYRPPELLMGSTRYGPAVDMWSVGCIFAELLHGKPILPGKLELDQLSRIFELCGSPDEAIWPGCSKLPWYAKMKPDRVMKRRVRDYFKHFDRHALDLVERMLTLNPQQRITAKDALDAEYFWTDPVPCLPSSLPKYEASHEFQTKKKRQQHRQQQDELAKRQKTFQQQQHNRLPPLQQPGPHGNMQLRPGPTHPAQQPSQLPSGQGHHYGGRGPGGPQRHSQGGRPAHGSQGGGYNAGRGPGGSYPGPSHQQVPNYTAPALVGQAAGGRGAGYVAPGGYPLGAPYGAAGGRPPMVAAGRGQPYVAGGPPVPSQPPPYVQPYIQPPGQYVDIDGSYARANHAGYTMPPGSPQHRPDYHRR